jgi:hypothetical protein
MMIAKLGKDIAIWNTGHFIDVFWGRSSWKPHARFQRKRVKNMFVWERISGSPPPSNVMFEVQKVM